MIGMARAAGYVAGVTLDRRIVTSRDGIMVLPRFLMTDSAARRSFRLVLDTPDWDLDYR